ncbi:MAG: hypothetical protein ACR2MQ_10125 [Gemmatimonadaceae bacterium]
MPRRSIYGQRLHNWARAETFFVTHQRKQRSQFVLLLTGSAAVVTAAPAMPVAEQPAWH